MTREKFIEALDRKSYSYEIVGDKIVVNHRTYIHLKPLETIPPGVEFRNRGAIDLGSLETLPPGVVFRNGGDINLNSLQTIPPSVEFRNSGDVNLESLIGGWFNSGWFSSGWKGKIKGISPNTLLNKMIADGVFDRR